MFTPDLSQFDAIVINSSGGKDSLAALHRVATLARRQHVPTSRLTVQFCPVGRLDWPGIETLIDRQAQRYGLSVQTSRYRDRDGHELDLLDYIRKRKYWPSAKHRFCTSEFKRAVGDRYIRSLARELRHAGNPNPRILNVLALRAEESRVRANLINFTVCKRLTCHLFRVFTWLAIQNWDTQRVWKVIHANKLPYHPLYDQGFPRLSCAFCIFASRADLTAAARRRPELLAECLDIEREIGHTFQSRLSLREIAADIQAENLQKTASNPTP